MSGDQLIEIEELLPQLSSAMAAIRLDDTARRALDSLKDAPRKARRFESFVAAIQTLGPGCAEAVRTPLYAAMRQATEVGEALEAATDSAGVQDASADFLQSLVPAVGRLEMAVSDAWRKVVREKFEPLAGTGALLEVIPATHALGAELKATVADARRLAENRVAADEFATSVSCLIEAQARLQEKVQAASGGQPEVDAFLDALTHNQATLRHMTPGVIRWLEDNDALDAFAVRAAS
jgi:hypothetical protein